MTATGTAAARPAGARTSTAAERHRPVTPAASVCASGQCVAACQAEDRQTTCAGTAVRARTNNCGQTVDCGGCAGEHGLPERGSASAPSARRHAAAAAPTPKPTRTTAGRAASPAMAGPAPARSGICATPEVCDGVDNDVDGAVDEGAFAPPTRSAVVGAAAAPRGRGTATGTTTASNSARTSSAAAATRVPVVGFAGTGSAAAPMARRSATAAASSWAPTSTAPAATRVPAARSAKPGSASPPRPFAATDSARWASRAPAARRIAAAAITCAGADDLERLSKPGRDMVDLGHGQTT